MFDVKLAAFIASNFKYVDKQHLQAQSLSLRVERTVITLPSSTSMQLVSFMGQGEPGEFKSKDDMCDYGILGCSTIKFI